MSYHPRIQNGEVATLCTTRSRNSELWLINNPRLEERILGYVAKYRARYEVELYAFGIEGSHIHALGRYPQMNQSSFKRDLNSSIARNVARLQPGFPGGALWGRRYSAELVPGNDDIEEYFFYIVLQAVKDGLVDKISEYPGYNCFHDAVNGVARVYEVVNWAAYHERKRWNPNVKVKDFVEKVELKYKRLPGYEHLSQSEYRAIMYQKLEDRRVAILRAREGKPSVGAEALKRKTPGTPARNPKRSGRMTHRPRVLSICPKRRAEWKDWYFKVYFQYKEASRRYRLGELDVRFPVGTHKPPPSTLPVLA